MPILEGKEREKKLAVCCSTTIYPRLNIISYAVDVLYVSFRSIGSHIIVIIIAVKPFRVKYSRCMNKLL